MMREAILNFPKQFEYRPSIENFENYKPAKKFVVCGMGGSALAASILQAVKPGVDLLVHRDYGLPGLPDEPREELIVLSSYSGNTEEVVEAFKQTLEKKLSAVVISIGGKLIDLAKAQSVPYIKLPDTGIQPRSALGFSFLAMLKVVGDEELLVESHKLAKALQSKTLEKSGKALAERAKGRIPIIYASTRNRAVGYNWKIKLNETGKIPAFYNVFPELNHNEMTGFDVAASTTDLSKKLQFIILRDSADHPQIQKRMEVLQKLYRDRALAVETVELAGRTRMEKIFSSLILADWFAFYTAEQYGLESEQVPMVEEFKKLIAR